MEKRLIEKTLDKLRANSSKRNFKQSIDLVINLKQLDLKNTEHQINMFASLPHATGKKNSICAFVDSELEQKAKEICDETITVEQFGMFKTKAAIKKLVDKHEFFIAQASIMPKVATVFGKYLGPRGKMPNPKLGSVLQPNTNINQLYGSLKNTVNLITKNEPTIKCKVGNEDIANAEVAENISVVYNSVVTKLPSDKENIKSVMIKFTMGPAFVIGDEEQSESTTKQKPEKNQ